MHQNHMSKLILVFLLAVAAAAQTAKFPTAVATDADLLVAKDRSSSALASGINASTLTVPVVDGTTFVAYEVITIDAEQIQICVVAGNTLTACAGGRGFGGTTANTHAVSAAVRGQITAWHFNALSKEVQAIQVALGASLANVGTTAQMASKSDVGHQHNPATDLVTGAVPTARGGTGADNSAATGFQRYSSGTGSVAPFANTDLPDAFDISGKTSTKPLKLGTALPGTCGLGEAFYKTDATPGEGLYFCTSSNTWTQGRGAFTGLKSITLFDPVTGDSGRIQIMFPVAVTITRVACSVKAATSVTIQLDERVAATPDTAGTDVLTGSLACDTNQEVTTSFANAGIAAQVPVALTISAVSGTPDTLRVHIEYTEN